MGFMSKIMLGAADKGLDIATTHMGNKFSAKEARKNRDFQERMAGTQWQRRVADMRKAGINPLFGISGGSGAMPGGSQGQSHSASGGNSLTKGVEVGQKGTRLTQELLNMKAVEDKDTALAEQASSATSINRIQAQLLNNQIPLSEINRDFNVITKGQALDVLKRGNEAAHSAVERIRTKAAQDGALRNIRNLTNSSNSGSSGGSTRGRTKSKKSSRSKR